MIQLLCFSNYSPQKFNQIPCFDRQVPIMGGLDLPGVLRKIGQVFIKYEAQKEFGLSIIHRHFHLNSNEILVDVGKADGTVSIAAPWHFTRDGEKMNGPLDQSYLESKGLSIDPKSSSITPMSWAFDPSSGELVPFEFHLINGSGEELPKIPQPFATHLFEALSEMGLLELFGIRRTSQKFWETTDAENRANIAHYGDIPIPLELQEKMKNVCWSFDWKGEWQVDGDCVNCNCCAHGGGSSCGCGK